VCIPVNGIEYIGILMLAVSKVNFDDWLAGSMKQGVADLSGDTVRASCDIRVAEGVW
jgi:hypothetical protein